jgi:acyl carrier protein
VETEAAVAPRTPVEEVLAAIWAEAEVLGVEQLGVHDNFFELGGHSLLATRVISRVRKAFQVEVPLRSLFEAPTVAGLAEKVESALGSHRGSEVGLRPVGRDQALPLSFAQQRLWFLDQFQPGSQSYNVPAAVRIRGPLQVAALERSLSEIVRRHEVLRTRFVLRQGEPVQEVLAAQELPLAVVDFSAWAEEPREQRVAEFIAAEAAHRFDLSRGPLLRVHLLRLQAEEHVLVLNLHHIVSDGWSLGVLLEELGRLYEAERHGVESGLAEPGVQYGDFAVWQREWLQGEVLEEQLAYWRRQLAELVSPEKA